MGQRLASSISSESMTTLPRRPGLKLNSRAASAISVIATRPIQSAA
jgi:hypothetical protein